LLRVEALLVATLSVCPFDAIGMGTLPRACEAVIVAGGRRVGIRNRECR
jgi:hypothetical protein